MKISGFSFVRNGIKLYYPAVESVKSILPIVDEFVIAVATGDDDDSTREQIATIGDPKVKIIDTTWNEKYFKKGVINAIQTNIAKQACTGDWLFYLQADEVVHEKYLPIIEARCEELLDNDIVEGMLFQYKHFWGDYNHYHSGHGWYPNEIRIIRNRPDIYSWQSAQSFRKFDFFDNPRQETGHHKLRVAKVAAEIYHYGWVKPPEVQQLKQKGFNKLWHSDDWIDRYVGTSAEYDYSKGGRLRLYDGSHPSVMAERVCSQNWSYFYDANKLHQPLKEIVLDYIEDYFGWRIGEYKNYTLL
ncbi:MAG: hypothetical protein MUC94_09255 [bacterium]|nr:hypothetical protein [bacterium]